MIQVCHERSTQTVGAHQGIKRRRTTNKVVLAIDIGMRTPIGNRGIGLHASQTIAAIVELSDVGLGLQACFGRHDIGALALHVDGTRKRRKSVVGQELLQWQVVGFEMGIVSHSVCIELHVARKCASCRLRRRR